MPLGKNPPALTGAVFVLAAQAVDSPQENSVTYGELASWGIYIQSDPIGLAGGWNGYTYADNTPLTKTDPNGLQAIPFPLPPPPGVPSPGTGGGSGGYDPRTDRFTPAPTVTLPTLPNWRDLFKSKSSELEQCEAEAEEKLDRDYAYCKALGATYNDYRTRKACEERAFEKYAKKLKECKQQCP